MNTYDNIYSSVPNDAMDCDPLYTDRDKIYYFLLQRPGEFFTAKKIAESCGFPTRGSQTEVRREITKLLELDKRPIIATGKGFGYVTNPHQIRFYAEKLEERMQGLQRRIKVVYEIANNMGEYDE